MPTTAAASQLNREVLRRLNREITLRASQFANALFAGVFRAVFCVEKAYEFTEPEVFQPDYEPQRILWSRLNAYHLTHLPLAIANGDVLASRYQLFTEYDFVVVVDVSQSMMLEWWEWYGGELASGQEVSHLATRAVLGDRTKLFLLKYTLASFLYAAKTNQFYSYVLLAGGDQIQEYDSRRDSNLEESLLERMDEHFRRLAASAGTETPRLGEALRRVSARRRRAIVLCLSDFRDTLIHCTHRDSGPTRPALSWSEILLPLAQIAAQHRALALQVVDRHELEVTPEEAILHGTKNSPYVSPELHARNESWHIKKTALDQHARRVQEWAQTLRRNVPRFGIKFEQIIAGKDDERIDKKIYDLGVTTSM